MSKATHTKSTERYETGAKARQTAAEHHDESDHAKAEEHSKAARGHSETAYETLTKAHGKSAAHDQAMAN